MKYLPQTEISLAKRHKLLLFPLRTILHLSHFLHLMSKYWAISSLIEVNCTPDNHESKTHCTYQDRLISNNSME